MNVMAYFGDSVKIIRFKVGRYRQKSRRTHCQGKWSLGAEISHSRETSCQLIGGSRWSQGNFWSLKKHNKTWQENSKGHSTTRQKLLLTRSWVTWRLSTETIDEFRSSGELRVEMIQFMFKSNLISIKAIPRLKDWLLMGVFLFKDLR